MRLLAKSWCDQGIRAVPRIRDPLGSGLVPGHIFRGLDPAWIVSVSLDINNVGGKEVG